MPWMQFCFKIFSKSRHRILSKMLEGVEMITNKMGVLAW